MLDREFLEIENLILVAVGQFIAANPEFDETHEDGNFKPLPYDFITQMKVPNLNGFSPEQVRLVDHVRRMLNYFEYISLGVRSGDLDATQVRHAVRSMIWRNYWLFEQMISKHADAQECTLSNQEARLIAQTRMAENLIWLVNLYELEDSGKLKKPQGRRPILPVDY